MKVIALLPNERVLVDLSAQEFANVLGRYSRYDIKIDAINKMIAGGQDIGITDIYNKHRSIKSLQQQKDYQTARTKLKEMLDALTEIEDKIMKFECIGGEDD